MADLLSPGVALPLLSIDTTVGEALDMAVANGAVAVVTETAGEYQLYSTAELLTAAVSDAIGEALIGERLDALDQWAGRRQGVFGRSRADVEGLFAGETAPPIVASVFAGGICTMAVAYENPMAQNRLVPRVWVCPDDGEESPSSGVCILHGRQRVPKV